MVAFLDDATRFPLHVSFYEMLDARCIEDAFREDVRGHGVPESVHFDNGKQYRMRWMARACSKLGIRLLYTRPYSPESTQIEEIIGHLNYAAERQLFAVMTVGCGLGETTAIRRFTNQLGPSRFKLLYLSDSKLTPLHFYKGMLEHLGLEAKFYRGDSKRQLHQEIELMKGIHKLTPVVVVDEAHLLDRKMLEEVRFLLSLRMDAQSPMALIMVSQTELWDRLQLQSFAAIRQRIDIQFKLDHLDRSETEQYMNKHLRYQASSETSLVIWQSMRFSATQVGITSNQ